VDLTVLLVGTDMGYLAQIAARLSREGFGILVTADRAGLAIALEREEMPLVVCDLRNPADLQTWVPGFADYAGPLFFLSDLTLTDESFGGLEPVEILPCHDIDALVERLRELGGS
jgi:hypothetical protein